jgi:hypothetical protein
MNQWQHRSSTQNIPYKLICWYHRAVPVSALSVNRESPSFTVTFPSFRTAMETKFGLETREFARGDQLG